MASLVIAITLLAIKFAAYPLTDSSVIVCDAVDSIVNVLASALAWYSIVLAHRPSTASLCVPKTPNARANQLPRI